MNHFIVGWMKLQTAFGLWMRSIELEELAFPPHHQHELHLLQLVQFLQLLYMVAKPSFLLNDPVKQTESTPSPIIIST